MNSLLEAIQRLNNKQPINEMLDKDYVNDGLSFAFDILTKLTPDECSDYYYREYAFDRDPPEDDVEKVICFALKSKLKLDESMRDDIDADRDDKVEKARAKFNRARDDADSDRDYKLKKKGLKESDAPAATSIEDAQKWVDYDMKKYGKISNRTNTLVRKAGFEIVKDEYGDYEVIAADK